MKSFAIAVLCALVLGMAWSSAGLSGDVSGLSGNVTGLSGDVTGLSGDVDDCCLSEEDRLNRVNVSDLVLGE